MKQKMLDLFEKVFGDTKDVNVYFAPGQSEFDRRAYGL